MVVWVIKVWLVSENSAIEKKMIVNLQEVFEVVLTAVFTRFKQAFSNSVECRMDIISLLIQTLVNKTSALILKCKVDWHCYHEGIVGLVFNGLMFPYATKFQNIFTKSVKWQPIFVVKNKFDEERKNIAKCKWLF